jgi:hypothetical protein
LQETASQAPLKASQALLWQAVQHHDTGDNAARKAHPTSKLQVPLMRSGAAVHCCSWNQVLLQAVLLLLLLFYGHTLSATFLLSWCWSYAR